MNEQIAFEEALDAVERLDIESQKELAEILARRLAEHGR
jgi:hypothetical protein